MTTTTYKTALVTGGGSGLGLAIAKVFAENGITTIIVGRDEAKLQAAQASIGANCFYKSCDLSQLELIPPLIDAIAKEYGTINILVNNAGINQKKPFVEVTDAEFHRILTTNVSAVFATSREVVKQMTHGGCIINISSMAAQYGIPKVIAYSASKTAIDGMTRAMAVELAPMNIRVNAIAPGFIYSDMTAKALDSDPERKAKVFGRTPMGHMGQPDDIAAAAMYLISDGAKYVTGVVLPVDGGNSIGF
jgi:NAD(P)-dependent dehydrogenase (short-subunit alcohol dehydrogenase family)